MTAFYMFRLMSMTFLGTVPGAGVGGRSTPATRAPTADDAHARTAGTGTAPWHGPHESPRRDDRAR